MGPAAKKSTKGNLAVGVVEARGGRVTSFVVQGHREWPVLHGFSKKEVTMQGTNHKETGQSTVLLGWIYIVANVLLLLAGAVVFFLLFGLGYASCEWESFIILSGLGLFLGVLIILLAFVGILAGCGLIRGCAWGRTLGIIVAVLARICFPIGTLIGIFALFLLLQDKACGCYRRVETCAPKDLCYSSEPSCPPTPCGPQRAEAREEPDA